jgi:hypothetical protein
MTYRLSPARRLGIEFLRQGRKVPSVPVARTCNLAAVAEHREKAFPKSSWTALFIKAYALVQRDYPELRRAYLPLPYARLYEHPHSTCALVVEREWQNETVLLGAKIRGPEDTSLEAIQAHIRRFKDAPVRAISDFRMALRVGRMPGLLRRFLYWMTLSWSGATRAKRLGTFMVSSYGSLGAEQLHPIAPYTTLLTFGPVSPAGAVVVKVIYDHRVMDGRLIARCLAHLEHVFHTAILDELKTMQRSGQAA